MMDPRDRLVEYALGRLFRPDPEEADLSGRVRRSWERGVVGPDLDDLDWDEAAFLRTRRRPIVRAGARPTWPYLTAAAAALVMALGATLWLRRGPAPLGELSRPVAELVEGRWVPTDRDRLLAGEPVFVTGGSPATVTLARGRSLIVQPGTLFTLFPHEPPFPGQQGGDAVGDGGTRVDLEWGTLETLGSGASVVLAVAGSRVVLPDGARARAHLTWDRRSPAPGALHVVEAVRRGLARGALGRLTVEVIEGEARLEGAGETLTMPAGSRQLLALETLGPRALAGDLGERVASGLGDLMAEAERYDALGRWEPSLDGAFVRLSELLDGEPAGWFELTELLRAEFSVMVPNARYEALALLALDDGRISRELARDTLREHPEWFEVEHLVAFAERDGGDFEREVWGIVMDPDSNLKSPWNTEPRDPLIPAVYLALRGETLGVGLLKAELEDPAPTTWGQGRVGDVRILLHRAAAEAGLAALEGRSPVFGRVCGDLAAQVLELLEAKMEPSAAQLALVWEYLVKRAEEEPGPMRVSLLIQRVTGYVLANEQALIDDPARIERLVADLEGR